MIRWHSRIRPRPSRLHSDESGQGLAEYALILSLIAVACAVALGTLGTALNDTIGFKLFSLL